MLGYIGIMEKKMETALILGLSSFEISKVLKAGFSAGAYDPEISTPSSSQRRLQVDLGPHLGLNAV